MNPELLTIEVPEHLLKAIQSKLDYIFTKSSKSGQLRKTKSADQTALKAKIHSRPRKTKRESSNFSGSKIQERAEVDEESAEKVDPEYL
jgi:hypothetical protein